MLSSSYLYTSVNGVAAPCKYDKKLGKVSTATTAYKNVTTADFATIAQMKSAVAIKPNSAYISAENSYFMSYSKGILQDKQGLCGTKLDQAVVIVGYGTDDTGIAYWTVRNSYGAWWGESGYFRVEQTEGPGVCGINTDV